MPVSRLSLALCALALTGAMAPAEGQSQRERRLGWGHFFGVMPESASRPTQGRIEVGLRFSPALMMADKTVLIRVLTPGCAQMPVLKDAAGRVFPAAACAPGAPPVPEGWQVKLADGAAQGYRLAFVVPPGVVPALPYDLEIPVRFAASDEADHPPQAHHGILFLRWDG